MGKENVEFLETKEKDVKMGWMNGIPWVDCHTLEARTVGVDCHTLEARTVVVEQEGWEISILSQLRTELMCHLA